jgi:predicted glycoside hydrolase/deacetylase ChbG (UPF0249 family)
LTSTTPVTPVVICADDYALTPGVCAGIIELAELGRISATSAMTLSPHWPSWARQARALQTRIDVGLHLDWTSDFAQQQGFGASLGQVMLRSLLRTLSPVTVRAHIERQLDLFEQHTGTAPDHVDGHQHVQQFPVIREALVDTLIRRYPAAHRPWLRVSQVPSGAWDIKAKIINAMGAQALLSLAQAQGLAHSQHLTGVYDFSGDVSAYRHRLQQWLTHLPTGAVLMCHPGTDSDPGAPYAQARPQEQQVLREAALQDLLSRQQIRIVRGTALFSPHPTHTAPRHDH